MGDRTFATEGDSVHVGPVDPAGFDDVRLAVDDADAYAGVARRLQARLDRQLWLLARLEGDPLQQEPAELPELLEIARRMRRDSESLLLLAGSDPGAGEDAPRSLDDVLADAAAAAEEPRRIDVRPAPPASIVPGAATEVLHVVAELLDHATAVYPGARVEVTAQVENGGRIAVEVRAVGAARHDPDGLGGRRALDAAERLARRSHNGVKLRRELPGHSLVASVVCPAGAVVVQEARRPLPSGDERRPAPPTTNGTNGHAPLDLPVRPFIPAPTESAADRNGVATPESGIPLVPEPSVADLEALPVFSAVGGTNGSSRKVDELFGPITDIPFDPRAEQMSTPIFEAIASAWFSDEPSGEGKGSSGPLDWESPSDLEWRAAAERASRSEPAPLTANGLPRRRPGNQLVPPPRSSGSKQQKPAERVPDRIRDRLSGYQRGLQQGRHRAESAPTQAEPGDPEFW